MQNITTDPLDTPVYLKEKDFVWPSDKLFYLMTADGLMICRNHMWFRSCALAKTGPNYLEKQKETCALKYPEIPRALVEKSVGFFLRIYKKEHWESALILVFNRETQQMELVCPDQTCSYGSVNYDTEKEVAKLPHGKYLLIGDLHSHCNFSPEPSMTDTDDELKRPGLHIVVGHLGKKEPEFYCAAVVDGCRFECKIEDVIEGFDEPVPEDEIPQEWIEKVKEKKRATTCCGCYSGYGSKDYDPDEWKTKITEPNAKDRENADKVLREFATWDKCPDVEEVQQELYLKAFSASWGWAMQKAVAFCASWKKGGKHEEKAPETKAS